MKISKDSWVAEFKATAEKLKAKHGPSDGVVCAIATLRYLRNEILSQDIGAEPASGNENIAYARVAITDGINELAKQILGGEKLFGFASNASAAAGAAGLKEVKDSISSAEVASLMG
jgi:hypothetical protein